jgi:hypothetical protein
MGRIYSVYGDEEECIEDFERKVGRKEANRKT